MLHILVDVLVLYLCLGMVLYVWGHPRTFMKTKSNTHTVRGTTTSIGRHLAHGVQVANFALHGIPRRKSANTSSAIGEIYLASVKRGFEKSGYFITTGSPHARALYLRNYAWF